jgi:hypothetical protein
MQSVLVFYKKCCRVVLLTKRTFFTIVFFRTLPSRRDGFTGGGCGGVLFFMIKQKIIRDKMRFSNLSNNMMISEL